MSSQELKRIWGPTAATWAVFSLLAAGPAMTDNCTQGTSQATQSSVTQGDVQLMENAGKFIFGVFLDYDGFEAASNLFDAAIGDGLSPDDDIIAAVTCQQAEIVALQDEVKNLKDQVSNLQLDVARNWNTSLAVSIDEDRQALADDLLQLNPSGSSDPRFRKLVSAGALQKISLSGQPKSAPGPQHPPVDAQTAHQVALDARRIAMQYLSGFQGHWVAEDVDSADWQSPSPTATPSIIATFDPYPALHVYLLALQVWTTAMQFEELDEGPGGLAQIKSVFWPDLAKHRSFLKSYLADDAAFIGAVAPDDAGSLPDQIKSQLTCGWQPTSMYPNGNSHQCQAAPFCADNIEKKQWTAANSPAQWNAGQVYAFNVATSDTMCSFDPRNVGPPAMQANLYDKYGLTMVQKMSSSLDNMYSTGFTFTAANTGTFGGSFDPDALIIYSVDGGGKVFRSLESGRQRVAPPQQVATGWTGARALLPGGGSVFYTVNQGGALDWYNFANTSLPPAGPVQLSTAFGAYKSVFGGSDGVIYGVDAGGKLVWYRNTDLSAGGGPAALIGPKTVASGWGQYAQVFSAGSGVIYALKSDGSLLWFRHTDYLTGDSIDPTKVSGSGLKGAALTKHSLIPHAHWQGPIEVGSGWTGIKTLQAGGDGIILAVKSDGNLLWYKHDDYLTGTSVTKVNLKGDSVTKINPDAAAKGLSAHPTPHWEGPATIGSGWQKYALLSAVLDTTAPAPIVK